MAGDCGGVRAHGTFVEGSVKEPERSTEVLVRSGSAPSMPDEMDYSCERQTLQWKSDSLIVLGARESRVQGEAAKQMTTDRRETSPARTEAGV